MRTTESSVRRRPSIPGVLLLALFATGFFLGSLVVPWCSPKAEATAGSQGAPVIQPRAHSHNDYLHRRPLLDALALGFCSVEADIYLVDGERSECRCRDGGEHGRDQERASELHGKSIARGIEIM